VPAGILFDPPCAGIIANDESLHIVLVTLLIVGFGLIVIVTVNVFPGQLPGEPYGVTVYVAVCATFVPLNNVSAMLGF
jgi:hypothetical protein